MRRSWLIVLAACLLAASAGADDQVIYPRTTAPAGVPAAPAPAGAGLLFPLLALGAAAAGGWLLWRQRRLSTGSAAGARKLAVTETRALGNRQYLIVADYDGRKFLLGVCPGRIELLAPLEGEKK
ncbi:MAG: flagellar biosynthetic protein FliO [Opitutales bacterium]